MHVMDIVNSSGPQDVGLYLGGDDWEYPFWILRDRDISFHHVWVGNQSRDSDSTAASPAFILATPNTKAVKEVREYHVEYADDNVRLLIRDGHNNRLHSTGNSAPLRSAPFPASEP